MLATRLYQNTARVHFDAIAGKDTRFGRRLIYGGHVISLARALSFNGLANGLRVAAINAGSHVTPTFGGDTIYAWSEVLEKAALPSRESARCACGPSRSRPAPGTPCRARAPTASTDLGRARSRLLGAGAAMIEEGISLEEIRDLTHHARRLSLT